jgi:uncharacterized repeat protein (TIGR02543 family)
VGALPAIPKKTNYLFDGWYTAKDGGGNKVTAATPVISDTTYYAKWAAVPDGWAYNSDTGGMSKTFGYKSDDDHVQSFNIVVEGKYTFELKGAGGGKWNSAAGGTGGYAKGSISNLPKNETLYVYVGGKGGDSGSDKYGGARGWNGGGKGGNGVIYNGTQYTGGGGGGGATDVRFEKNIPKTRIIVAGGGGGRGRHGNSPGNGGGETGGKGRRVTAGSGGIASSWADAAAGGNQTTGHNFGGGGDGGNGVSDSFSAEGNGGGGGGYYGGKGYTPENKSYQNASGGGGSGFVNGLDATTGTTNTDYKLPEAYKNYKFTDAYCKPGEGSVSNGSAKITYAPLN